MNHRPLSFSLFAVLALTAACGARHHDTTPDAPSDDVIHGMYINGLWAQAEDVDDPVVRAEQMLQDGRVDDGARALETIVASTPAGWKSYYADDGGISVAFWTSRELEVFVEAHPRETRAIVWVGPSYSKAAYDLAFIAVERGDYATARRYVEQALALEPTHPLILSEAGMVAQGQQRNEEALAYYKRAISARTWAPPEHIARAQRGAAVVLIDLNRLNEAETLLHDSLKLAPNNPLAQQELEYIATLRAGGDKRQTGVVDTQ